MTLARKESFRRFEEFHTSNPKVWYWFVYFADQMARVKDRWSADAVLHRIRWELALRVETDEEFKFSDHFTCYYSRMYLLARPFDPEFFHTRGMTDEEEDWVKAQLMRILDG